MVGHSSKVVEMGTERFGSVICCSTVEMRLGTITIVNLFPKGFSISAIFESRAFFFWPCGALLVQSGAQQRRAMQLRTVCSSVSKPWALDGE